MDKESNAVAAEGARRMPAMAAQGGGQAAADRLQEYLFVVDCPCGLPGDAPVTAERFREVLVDVCGGSSEPLLKALRIGMVRGVVAIVGCAAAGHDALLADLARELIAQDVLVLVAGCSRAAVATAGLLEVAGMDQAGTGLADFCGHLGMPPVLHVASGLGGSKAAAAVPEPPAAKAAAISRRITATRLALGLNDRYDGTVYS